MRKLFFIVGGALLFLLAACVPGTSTNVRSQLPVPVNFQVSKVGDGYHISWAYLADLSKLSAFNLYREETPQNGSRIGAENRVFHVTWNTCDNGLCLNVFDSDAPEGEDIGLRIGSGELECNATGCYFAYTDNEGLDSTSTYRYFLRMVNADGVEEGEIIVTDEERSQQEAGRNGGAGQGPGEGPGEGPGGQLPGDGWACDPGQERSESTGECIDNPGGGGGGQYPGDGQVCDPSDIYGDCYESLTQEQCEELDNGYWMAGGPDEEPYCYISGG